jgi:regulatory protein
LGRRDHSREELRRKLSRRGHEKESVEEAIRQISRSYGMDDQRFARSYVRMRSKTRGPMAIAGELAARGVDRAATEAALAEFGPAEQLLAATILANKLSGRVHEDLDYRQMLDKIGSKLARRGFSTTIVRAACHAVATGTAPSPEG